MSTPSLTNNNTLISDFKDYTTIIVNLSNYAYLFKSIDCLDQYTIEENQESILPTTAIVLISCLMLLTILKTIVIYLSYYLIVIPKAILHTITAVIQTKGEIRIGLMLIKMGKAALSHLQTFYSYNFYAYTDPVSGVVLMLLYLIFIVANMLMSIIYFIDPNLTPFSIPQNLLYIAGFLPQLFLQIYLPLYYYKRKANKFKLFFTTSFTFWFFLTGMIGYILNQKRFDTNDSNSLKVLFELCYSIGFHIFIALLQILALRKIIFYSLNKKSIRMIMAETERTSKIDIASTNINKGKCHLLSKKYRLNSFYYDSNSNHFFEMNDRFHRKIFLLASFSLYFINNLYCILLMVFLAFASQDLLKEYNSFVQIGLLVETVLLNIIAWNTFMKIQISRVFLY